MADFIEAATITGRIREPAAWINTGHHPAYGSFVTIQDFDPEWFIVHSEFRVDMPLPAHMMPVVGSFDLAAA